MARPQRLLNHRKHLRALGLQFQALFRRCYAFRAWHWRAKVSSFFSPVSLHKPAKPYGSRVCGLEISGIFAGAVLATVKNNLVTHQKYDENVEKVLNLLAQIEHFLRKLAERVGFEPTVPLPVHLISSQGRYNHFDTAPHVSQSKFFFFIIRNSSSPA